MKYISYISFQFFFSRYSEIQTTLTYFEKASRGSVMVV